MPAPDPEGMSLLAKAIAAGVAVIAPIWGVRTWLEKRFDRKADKHTVANTFGEVKLELGIQRQNVGKIFDQIRDGEQKSEARHREILMHLLESKKGD